MNIYLLSIYSEYTDLISSGEKKWDFRKNPNFSQKLAIGDIISIVATYRQQYRPPQITCVGLVENILRCHEVYEYFCDKDSKR